MNTPIIVRRATSDDAPAIAAVNVASWRAAYRGLMSDAYLDALSVSDQARDWAASIAREDSRGKLTFVACAAEAVIGYATIGSDINEPSRGLLYLMYVDPSHWGHGAGRQLMDAARDAFSGLGYRDALLWALDSNHRARRFYEAAGWAADGHRQDNDYAGTSLTAIRMALPL